MNQVDTKQGKATIKSLTTGDTVTCMFNPKEYTFSKQATWSRGNTSGRNLQNQTFSSGDPATIQMQLFFDTYEAQSDVRDETNTLWKMMLVDETRQGRNKKAEPPKVRFEWGQTWSFVSVITSLRQQFTLFLSSGVPVRSTVDVTLQQIEDSKSVGKQNPTSAGEGGARVWRVTAGDTLSLIAYREYGDPNLWRVIADANRLGNVRKLRPGSELVIPNV